MVAPVLLRRCLPPQIGAGGGDTPYRAITTVIPTDTPPNLPEEVDQRNVTHSILRQSEGFFGNKNCKIHQKTLSSSNIFHHVVKCDVCRLSLHVSDFLWYLPREEGVGEGPTCSRHISSIFSAHGFKPDVEIFLITTGVLYGPVNEMVTSLPY